MFALFACAAAGALAGVKDLDWAKIEYPDEWDRRDPADCGLVTLVP